MPRVKLFDEEEVLNKATELFWKKGFHATSMQDLVSHTGINRSSLYDTFGGKKELFDKALDHYRVTGAEEMRKSLNSSPDVKSSIRNLFSQALQGCDESRKGCFVVNTTIELMPGDDEMKAVLTQNKSVVEGILHDLLLAGEKNGQIPTGKDLKSIAGLLYALYSGIRVIAKIEPNQQQMMASIDVALALLD